MVTNIDTLRCHTAMLAVTAIVLFSTSTRLEAATQLETIEPGKLIVAFNGDMPNTGWENGKMVGLDGELLQWMADSLGLKIQPMQMEFSGVIESVKSKRADVLLGDVSWRPDKAKVLTLSDPIYYGIAIYAQKKSTAYTSIADLSGKIVASLQGFGLAHEAERLPGSQLKLYDTTDAALRDLLAGRSQVLFADSFAVLYAINQNPRWDIHGLAATGPYDAKFPTLSGAKWQSVLGVNLNAKNLAAALNEKVREAWQTCRNVEVARKYALARLDLFEPTPEQAFKRQGVDRPQDWQPPTIPEKCKSLTK